MKITPFAGAFFKTAGRKTRPTLIGIFLPPALLVKIFLQFKSKIDKKMANIMLPHSPENSVFRQRGFEKKRLDV